MKKCRKLLAVLALLLVGSMIFSACGSKTPAPTPSAPADQGNSPAPSSGNDDTMKIFMSVGTGGLGDGGYNDSAYAGAKKATDELGIELQVYEPKSISEIEAQFLATAESGEYALMLGIGVDNSSGVDKASDAFPNQQFAIYQAVYDKPNVLSANQAIEQGAYALGAMVATLYKENLLPGVPAGTHNMGIVIAMTSSEISKQIYAMTAGGKSVDPEFNVIVNEIGSWSDTAKAKELAVALYEKGCGVITHYAGAAGDGVFEAAKETGFYVIGAHGNQNGMAETTICSYVEDMEKAIYSAVKSFAEGTLKSGNVRYGLAENVVYITFDHSKVTIPDSVKQLVKDLEQKIISGEIVPPTTQEELDAFVANLN